MAVSFGSDHLALLVRHSVGVPLIWWFAGPWSLAFPFLVVAAYEASWRASPFYAIVVAELITGAIWGLYIVLSRPFPIIPFWL
jgi:hypothetical protein